MGEAFSMCAGSGEGVSGSGAEKRGNRVVGSQPASWQQFMVKAHMIASEAIGTLAGLQQRSNCTWLNLLAAFSPTPV